MRLRTWLVVLIIVALLATAAALGIAGVVASRDGWLDGLRNMSFGANDAYVKSGPEIRKDFSVQGPLVVDVRIDEGDVRVVSGGARASVIVTPTGKAATLEGAAAALASVKPDIRFEAGVLSVVWHGAADPRPRRADQRSLDVLVTLPASMTTTLTVQTRAADIAVRGVRGSVTIATAFGALHVRGVAGAVAASTASGDIVIEATSAGGGAVTARTEFGRVLLVDVGGASVRAEATSGDVDMRAVRAGGAGGLVATTRFGAVTLEGVQGTTVQAESDSGDVRVRLYKILGPVTVATQFGAADVFVPPDAGAEVTLETRFGSIEAPFPTDGRANRDDRSPVVGRIGRGGPPLAIRTQSGDVRLLIVGPTR